MEKYREKVRIENLIRDNKKFFGNVDTISQIALTGRYHL